MATDIQDKHFLFRATPVAWHPYVKLMRLDRPIGTWLLLLPCWWGLVLARGGSANLEIRDWVNIGLLGLGALLMRGAGCIVNDLWDQDLDSKVERTRVRPLPAGNIKRWQAGTALTILLAASCIVLLLLQSITDFWLALISLLLVVTYPLMKRVTWWPQLFLGFTFNWGALMGWAVVDDTLAAPAFLLYAGGVFWTLAYDTIYAHQDKNDDALIGIKSTALLFGNRSPAYIAIFFTAAIFLFVMAKWMAGSDMASLWLGILPASHAAWQLFRWRMDDAASSLGIFKSNRDFGFLVLLMLAV